MAIVLVLGHDDLEDEPQSSESKANPIISDLGIYQNRYKRLKTKAVKQVGKWSI